MKSKVMKVGLRLPVNVQKREGDAKPATSEAIAKTKNGTPAPGGYCYSSAKRGKPTTARYDKKQHSKMNMKFKHNKIKTATPSAAPSPAPAASDSANKNAGRPRVLETNSAAAVEVHKAKGQHGGNEKTAVSGSAAAMNKGNECNEQTAKRVNRKEKKKELRNANAKKSNEIENAASAKHKRPPPTNGRNGKETKKPSKQEPKRPTATGTGPGAVQRMKKVQKKNLATTEKQITDSAKALVQANKDALLPAVPFGIGAGHDNFRKLMMLGATSTSSTSRTEESGRSNRTATTSMKIGVTGTLNNARNEAKTNRRRADAATLVALDCEMVEDQQGKNLLARVSIVQEDLHCLLDTLVRPPGNDFDLIADYRTEITGLTRDSFAQRGSMSMKQVQRRVAEILATSCAPTSGSKWKHQEHHGTSSKNVLLIGHAVKNDLAALEFPFEWVGGNKIEDVARDNGALDPSADIGAERQVAASDGTRGQEQSKFLSKSTAKKQKYYAKVLSSGNNKGHAGFAKLQLGKSAGTSELQPSNNATMAGTNSDQSDMNTRTRTAAQGGRAEHHYVLRIPMNFLPEAFVSSANRTSESVPANRGAVDFPVADTQILYARKTPGAKNRSLQSITADELGEQIQSGQHDSVVDARATMRVYKKLFAACSTR
ncbi:unnamed protein product [Amoebophrya sp. A120]|nr:unnamed protein product [Amoebophrya sp. A120]|eukprot:GSA120T00004306001.1